ncbi:MAG: hypothetical protein ABSC94_28425 [Polyangiaceae bacterium]|jgi:hypothetical protein
MASPELPPTDFELMLASLEGLTCGQITERIKLSAPKKDAENFAVLVQGLSADAARFVAARTLARVRAGTRLECRVDPAESSGEIPRAPP